MRHTILLSCVARSLSALLSVTTKSFKTSNISLKGFLLPNYTITRLHERPERPVDIIDQDDFSSLDRSFRDHTSSGDSIWCNNQCFRCVNYERPGGGNMG